jgi:ATP-dependent DNA helicase RecG
MSEYLKIILQKPEGKTLEFKRDLSSPKGILKTIVAFSNSAGGKIVIGIDANKQIIGLEDPLTEEERLCNLIADTIHPRLIPNIEMISAENKTMLIVEVFPSNSRPHYLVSKGENQNVFVRLGSTNRIADKELIVELQRTATGLSFDELPMPELSISDLDVTYIANLFGTNRKIDENELLTLKLLTKQQGKAVPTIGGILLFGKERERYFPDVWIQCGRFVGKNKAEIFDHIEISEFLPNAIESVMLFMKKHANRGADFSEIRRKDVWSIPLGILREVIINAIVHADYSQKGAPFRIAFFDDRIEVENPGFLLPGMTIEDMKQGISKIRNPVIARVFRELNLIEQWGSGIPRIFKEADELGLKEPEIREIGMRLRFVIALKQEIISKPKMKKNEQRQELQPELRQELQPELNSESKLAIKILLILNQEQASKSQLAKQLGHKSVSGELNSQIKNLLQKDYIEMTIPEKPTSRNQKYRLTAKGKALFSSTREKTNESR